MTKHIYFSLFREKERAKAEFSQLMQRLQDAESQSDELSQVYSQLA